MRSSGKSGSTGGKWASSHFVDLFLDVVTREVYRNVSLYHRIAARALSVADLGPHKTWFDCFVPSSDPYDYTVLENFHAFARAQRVGFVHASGSGSASCIG